MEDTGSGAFVVIALFKKTWSSVSLSKALARHPLRMLCPLLKRSCCLPALLQSEQNKEYGGDRSAHAREVLLQSRACTADAAAAEKKHFHDILTNENVPMYRWSPLAITLTDGLSRLWSRGRCVRYVPCTTFCQNPQNISPSLSFAFAT